MIRPARAFRLLEPYLYVLPTVLGLLLFSAGAVAASFFMSFTQWDFVSSPEWVWLDNYVNLWQSDLFVSAAQALELPWLTGGSLYTRFGDVFAWACIIIAGLALIIARRGARRD